MTKPSGVSREFYDDAVRQRDAALERARTAEDRLAVLTAAMVELKRHDVDAPAAPSFNLDLLNAEHGLGSFTLAAIDEFCDGDPELRARLVARAHTLTTMAKLAEPSATPAEVDRHVGEQILEGDTG